MIKRYFAAKRTVLLQRLGKSGDVEFQDVDYVIYCTGYLYNFPFATKGSQAIFEPGFKVANLWRHTFYTKEPSLAFVGLPKMTAAFTVAEAQSAVVARAFSGRLDMPSNAMMQEWENQTAVQHVKDMRSDKTYHTLAQNKNEDREYVNMLQDYATSRNLREGYSKPPPRWCRCLDNARASAGAIRAQYKRFSKESDEVKRYFTSYSKLGVELVIPCNEKCTSQYSMFGTVDAVTCFLDMASR